MADRSCQGFHDGRRGACAAGLLAAVAIVGCHGADVGQNGAPAAKAVVQPIRAQVVEVRSSTWPSVVRAQGSLVADEVTVCSAKVAGRIAEAPVDLGDIVSQGAVLATLDQHEFRLEVALAQAQLEQARAALGLKESDPVEQLDPQKSPPVREARAVWDEAKANIDRLKVLLTRNAVAQEELDQAIAAEQVADARYSSAINSVLEKIAQIRVRSAELALAQQRMADSTVTAPFDGLVKQRHAERGTFVQVGEPIVTLVRTSMLRFRGTVPERQAHRLRAGQKMILQIESVEEPIETTVERVSPVVEERNRALLFEAQVDNRDGRFRTGLFAEAEVVVDPEARTIVVPATSVLEFAGAEKVWKVVDGVAKEQVVLTARRGKEGIEIISGLAEGDVILQDARQGRAGPVEQKSPVTEKTLPASTQDSVASGEELAPAEPTDTAGGTEPPASSAASQ